MDMRVHRRHRLIGKGTVSAIRIACFLLLLAAVLWQVSGVLKPKNEDGIYNMELFYELPENSVDVLFLGSSHAYCGFNTGVLWREQGIASYVLAGSQQPFWNSYHCLVEALKTQRPSLVVLDVYMAYIDTPYRDDSMAVLNTYGMRWSLNRIEAIKASAPKERWADLLLSYTQYHGRYAELGFSDILPYRGEEMYENWKGTILKFHTEAKQTPDVSSVTRREPMQARSEEYYRKILELCASEGIELLTVAVPYNAEAEKQPRINEAGALAKESGFAFVDFNLLHGDIDMDFSFDMADNGHLNAWGGAKFSSALGRYIKESYDIPDRRGEPAWSGWEADAEYIYRRLGENPQQPPLSPQEEMP